MPKGKKECKEVVLLESQEILNIVKAGMKKILVSPAEVLSSCDPGDEVQRRFRYQHTCTAYLALLMLTQEELQYNEILCEHHEDILCVNGNEFTGIQIKTRQLSDGPFELTDEALRTSIVKFIKLFKTFPGYFKQFIFISNCGHTRGEDGKSIAQLEKELSCEDKRTSDFQPNTLEKYVKDLIKETDSNRAEVVEILKLVKFQKMPDIDDIDPKIITDVIPTINGCENLPVYKQRLILDNLVNVIYLASSKKTHDPIKDYVSLIKGDPIKRIQDSEINAKRITIQRVNDIVKEISKNSYYLASNSNEFELSQHRRQVMQRKMNCGVIDPQAIEMMEFLREKAESYFFESYHKGNLEANNGQEISHIIKLVLNQAIEAKTRSKLQGAPYGERMLHNIEDRLEKIARERSDEVNNCYYEILKGLIGVLTGECKIAFSEVPEGGWNFDV